MKNSIAHHINITSNLITRRLYSAMQELTGPGFTPRQGQILHFLVERTRQGKEVFQRDIEQAFTIRRPTATGILQLMEKNGLIRREPVPRDARLKKLVITDEALAMTHRADEVMAQAEADLIEGITPDDLARFHAILSQMEKNLMKNGK